MPCRRRHGGLRQRAVAVDVGDLELGEQALRVRHPLRRALLQQGAHLRLVEPPILVGVVLVEELAEPLELLLGEARAKVVKLLGDGASCKVKLGEHVKSGEYHALKILKGSHALKEDVKKEIDLLAKLNHENIIRMFAL